MKQKFLEVGKIVGTHGIKGMVRIQPWSDSPEFLEEFDVFYLDKDGTSSVEVARIQPHGNVVLASLCGIDTIEQAENFRGKILYISRDDIELPEGRYFISDIIGAQVFDKDGTTLLGTLTDVSETGANDVWHITCDGKEYLVPAIDEVIVQVDIENSRIVLNPMKGIFDDAD